MKNNSWQNHYTKSKSLLTIPDENLVRLLSKSIQPTAHTTALDLGCGSGRHMRYLLHMNINHVLGMDISFNALSMCQETGLSLLVQNDNLHIPLKNNSVDIVIAWGSLHYNPKRDLPAMLLEIRRTLKPGGFLFATLRSGFDTYLKKGKCLGNDEWITDLEDIKGSYASFYSEPELKTNFNIFSSLEYGFIERSIIGDLNRKISHWVITCRT